MNKDLIQFAVNTFGHLIPRNEQINNFVFCNLIYMNYSINNPKTKAVYDEINKSTDLYFIRKFDKIIVKRI
jgi:hypothetical protein